MVNEENYEDVTEMDLIFEAHDKLDILIELLIEKGVISKEEYERKLDKYYENMEEE
jgi:hypothetical protein